MKKYLCLGMWRKKALLSRTTTALFVFYERPICNFFKILGSWKNNATMKTQKTKTLAPLCLSRLSTKIQNFWRRPEKISQNLPCLFSNLFHSGIVLMILPWESSSPSSRLCHRYSNVSALVFWELWFCPKCCKEPSIYVDIFSFFSQKKHRLLKLKIFNHSGDEDLPRSNTGSFVLRHYVSRGSAKFLWILFVLVYFW